MPARRSRKGSNSVAAKLISRANSAKVIQHQNNDQSAHDNISNNAIGSIVHANNGPIVNNKSIYTNNNNNINFNKTIGGNGNSSGIVLTAKQQQQLQRNAYLSTLTKEQLKFECRKRGQKTSGTKTDLVYNLQYNLLFFLE